MLSMFNMVFVENTLPIFLHENPRTQASETQIGSYMGIIQLTSALSQVLLGSLNDKVGSRKIIVSSLFLTGLSYLGMVYVTGAIPLFILGGLQGIFFAAADLSMMIHLMAIMPEGMTGVVMGVYSESENIGGMVAAPSLGLVYDSIGPTFSVLSVSAIIISNAFLSIPLIKNKRRR
jgi:sugar phosphate permease